MSTLYRVQQFQKLLSGLFAPDMTGAVLLPDGTPVHLKYTHLADIGTLPQAGRITQQYLQLKPNQIAIMNDPYSGGTLLSTVTLIMGVAVGEKISDRSDYILVYRFPLRPHLKFATNIDEEGLRIPPTPIVDGENINRELLGIMAHHPLSAEGFLERTLEGISRIKKIGDDFQRAFRIYGLNHSRVLVQNFLTHSHKLMKQQVAELPFGDTSIQTQLPDESKIRMHVEIHGEKIEVDFSGTTSSKSFHLTEAATFGACFGALATLLGQELPINGGTFQVLEVRTPSGTMLNAKYPAPTFLGMTEGVNLTAGLMLKALGQIHPQKQVSMSQPGPCTLDIQFDNRKHFFDTIAGGVGAGRDHRGEMGLAFWSRSPLQASIEDIETRFPLRVATMSSRPNSGGKGLQKGGEGLIKTFELTAPALVRWSLGPPVKIEGVEGGASGSESEIIFHFKRGTKEKGAPFGQMRLEAGDIITIHSAGGAGYGHSKS